jgi:hypothetical protein
VNPQERLPGRDAAADGTCDTAVVLAAAARLDAGAADLEIVEREHLLVFADGRLGFQHPLIDTAANGARGKQAAHRALADVLDALPEIDRRKLASRGG